MAFEGARLKTRRAHNLLVGLEKRVQRFIDSDPYAIYSLKDPHAREHVIFLKVTKAPRLHDWAIVAGDAVHNLRSALDHVVWELTIRGLGKPPFPLTKDWRRIEFPVFRERRVYLYGPNPNSTKEGVSGSGLYKIRSIDPRFYALFDSLQPFHDGPKRDRNLLQVLQELDLIDKHRALPVLLSVVVPVGATIRPTVLSGLFDAALEPVEVFKRGPFKDGTPLARVKETGSAHITAYGLNMHMEPQLAFRVKLKERRPTMGLALLPTLRGMHERVNEILDLFDAKLASLPGA
jgi:hypothetical protein